MPTDTTYMYISKCMHEWLRIVIVRMPAYEIKLLRYGNSRSIAVLQLVLCIMIRYAAALGSIFERFHLEHASQPYPTHEYMYVE